MKRRFTLSVLFIAFTLTWGERGFSDWSPFSSNDLETVSVQSMPDANMGSAFGLDFVFIYEEAAVQPVPLNGRAWEAQRSQLQMMLGSDMDVLSIEMPPGHFIEQVSMPKRHRKAKKVFVFPTFFYASNIERKDVSDFETLCIRVEQKSISYHRAECESTPVR